jgi:hypothetical protein
MAMPVPTVATMPTVSTMALWDAIERELAEFRRLCPDRGQRLRRKARMLATEVRALRAERNEAERVGALVSHICAVVGDDPVRLGPADLRPCASGARDVFVTHQVLSDASDDALTRAGLLPSYSTDADGLSVLAIDASAVGDQRPHRRTGGVAYGSMASGSTHSP